MRRASKGPWCGKSWRSRFPYPERRRRGLLDDQLNALCKPRRAQPELTPATRSDVAAATRKEDQAKALKKLAAFNGVAP